jgi:Ca-activated chloride channel family protein
MQDHNKLPLVKTSLNKLVDRLQPRDKVAIVVYAGAAGLVLPSTPGTAKGTIKTAINNLSAGGSTAGGAGIQLAYKTAQANFIKDGNNRIILVTDGDFNVGVSSDAELVKMIEEKRESGVFLTVCGFGMGNFKDSKMEKLADKGNGNYFYVDSEKEADKVFVKEMRATLFTIAKDVKIQVEFNPAQVASYRLVGYENRLLNTEDFDDDTKDAGELGAGHTVTALYEIIPAKSFNAGVQSDNDAGSAITATTTDLRYQQTRVKPQAYEIDEVLVVKLRYKDPDGAESKLIEKPLANTYKPIGSSSNNFRWSAAVAEFGMLLRDSKFKGDADYGHVVTLASGAKGTDVEGYRAEFIDLVNSCMKLVASK